MRRAATRSCWLAVGQTDPAVRPRPQLRRFAFDHTPTDRAFLRDYKDLEPDKWVKIVRWGDADEARALVLEGIERAKKDKGEKDKKAEKV